MDAVLVEELNRSSPHPSTKHHISTLFVDESPETISEILAAIPVGLIQFHGDEDGAFCRQFQRPWIKAIRVRDDMDVAASCRHWHGASGLLLDTWKAGVPGGTGKTFDWTRAGGEIPLPLVLAGGLNDANVGEAISVLRPMAVDVSGGVEAAPASRMPKRCNGLSRRCAPPTNNDWKCK